MRPIGIIGVVHVPAMPGDPAWRGASFEAIRRVALHDAVALSEGGVDGIIIENFGSAPFRKGTEGHRIDPHQVAQLTLIASAVRALHPGRVGVNCLRNDARSALGIAAATGLDFVRVNVHVGAYVTDQGLIEGEADRSLRYRQLLQAGNVAIWADVLVKHAAPLAPLTPEDATKDTLHRGHADAVIVTGAATGAPIDVALLRRVREAAGGQPVLLGSGLTPDNAPELVPLADGAIVGTWLKQDGRLSAHVDPERVRALVAATQGRWASAAPKA